MTWREQSLKVIRGVVADNPNASNDELRKIVSDAYPFGKRAMFPYKAWLKAVEQVLGPSKKKVAALVSKFDRPENRIDISKEDLFELLEDES